MAACQKSPVPNQTEEVVKTSSPISASEYNSVFREEYPEFERTTPHFPALSLYVIYREFVNRNPQITTIQQLKNSNYPSYLEQRLLTLYPEKAYAGVVAAGIAEVESYLLACQAYDNANGLVLELEDPLPTNIPNFEDEFLATGMLSNEATIWNQLEYYAMLPDRLVTRNELNSLVAQYEEPEFGTQGIILISVGAAITGYVIFRAYQAKGRAENREDHHYPTGQADGKKNDTFRHIYASMHLSRYVGRHIAGFVGWSKEFFTSNNPCYNKRMDLHNNRVGYAEKYDLFRQNAGSHSWGAWASNVSSFVNNSGNGVYYSGWDPNNTTTYVGCNSINSHTTAASKYIYYKQ